MFIKYLHESDLVERGFMPSNDSNLHPESFHRMQLNEDSGISTLMTVFVDSNLYSYVVCTEREGVVDRGIFTRKEELDAILKQFFEDDYVSFMERKAGRKYSLMEKAILRKRMKPLRCGFFDIARGRLT